MRRRLCYAELVSRSDLEPWGELAERLARAELRRVTWRGGVAKLSEMEGVDDRFWGAMSPERSSPDDERPRRVDR
jgi:hypothetical protein